MIPRGNIQLLFIKLFLLFLFIPVCPGVSAQKKKSFCSFGIDYRQLPIDIEDVPRGPGTNSEGGFYGPDFWRAFSLHGRLGISLEKNWQLSLVSYTRYNHFHWLGWPKEEDVPAEQQNLQDKKNFKYDVFADIEKKIRLKKTKERYLFFLTGIGLTNLNTRYNVLFEKYTFPSGRILPEKRFEGTLLRLTPRVSLGYQYNKIKGSLDAYIVEGPDLNNLSSLWLGATVSYEVILRKKKKR